MVKNRIENSNLSSFFKMLRFPFDQVVQKISFIPNSDELVQEIFYATGISNAN